MLSRGYLISHMPISQPELLPGHGISHGGTSLPLSALTLRGMRGLHSSEPCYTQDALQETLRHQVPYTDLL